MKMHLKPENEAGVWAMALLVILVTCVVVMGSGCILWTPTVVVAHPDAPALITEVRRRYYRTAVYDKASNSLIDAGWTRITKENLVGHTVSTFDWEAHIVKRSRNAHDPE